MTTHPTDDQNALYTAAAIIAEHRSASAVETSAWPRIVHQADRHGLASNLYWMLKRQSVALDDHSAWQMLSHSAHREAMHWVLMERAMRDISNALDNANIPALWIKGAVLAQTVYRDPATRPMGDLDVLVPFDQRESTLEIVQSLGYHFYDSEDVLLRRSDDAVRQKLSHHYHLRGGPAGQVILELHYRLLSYADSLLSPEQLDWFWSQRMQVQTTDAATFDTLTPAAHLLYLCAHALIQHGRDDFRLLRYLDIHLLIEHGGVNWVMVVERAAAFGWAPAVDEALRTCVEYFAAAVPDDVLDALARAGTIQDAKRVEQMSGAGHRWEQMRANLRALTLREAVAYAAQIVFPRPSYMRTRYGLGPGAPVWPHYLRRWADHAREVAASTWKRLTGRYR